VVINGPTPESSATRKLWRFSVRPEAGAEAQGSEESPHLAALKALLPGLEAGGSHQNAFFRNL
jgi:hypothetical protein